MARPGRMYVCQFVFLLVACAVALVLTVFINYSGSIPTDIGWFNNYNKSAGFPYPEDIQPNEFTFYVWPVIYIWQAVWILYVFVSICRRTRGDLVFLNPPVVTRFFLSMFCVAMVFNTGWFFLFGNRLVVWSFFDLFLLTSSIYAMLFVHHRAVDKYGCQLVQNHRFDLWANRILIQNGLAFYAGWCSIETVLNLTYVLAYGRIMTASGGNIDQSIVCVVGLAIIGFGIVLYFIFENFLWERYLRYTYTVWAVFLWTVIGLVAKNFQMDVNTFVDFGLLALTFILFIAKIVLCIWRSHAQPLYTSLSHRFQYDLGRISPAPV